jgi:hypothetical protein
MLKKYIKEYKYDESETSILESFSACLQSFGYPELYIIIDYENSFFDLMSGKRETSVLLYFKDDYPANETFIINNIKIEPSDMSEFNVSLEICSSLAEVTLPVGKITNSDGVLAFYLGNTKHNFYKIG